MLILRFLTLCLMVLMRLTWIGVSPTTEVATVIMTSSGVYDPDSVTNSATWLMAWLNPDDMVGEVCFGKYL